MKSANNRLFLVLFQFFLSVIVFFSIFDIRGVSLYFEATAAVVLYALPAVFTALFKHRFLKILGCIACLTAGYFMQSKHVDLVFHSILPVSLILLADITGESRGKSTKTAGRMIILNGAVALIVFVFSLFTEKAGSRSAAEHNTMQFLGVLALAAILLLIFCRPVNAKDKNGFLWNNAFLVFLAVDSLIEVLLYYKKGLVYNAAYYIIWISVFSFAVYNENLHLQELFNKLFTTCKNDNSTRR